MNRLEVRAAVLDCEGCPPNACSDGIVPFAGKASSGLAVMGEAPTLDDLASGRPFSGQAGELLRTLVKTEAAIDPGEVFWMNAVSCVPMQASGKTRAPNKNEVNACSDTRAAQLRLASAKWLVLAGNVALHTFFPSLRIGLVHGRVLHKDGLMLFPIYHPLAAIRNPAWVEDIRTDLSLLGRMIAELDWTLREPTCITCNRGPEEGPGPWRWTDAGLPYCNEHWKD